MPDIRLKIPSIMSKSDGSDTQYYNCENNRDLVDAINNTRRRLGAAMGKIARGEYTLPSETMEALYRLNLQLGLLNDELMTENVEMERIEENVGVGENEGTLTISIPTLAQFEFFDGKNDYLRKMSTVANLGEILNESVTAQDGSKTTVFGILSEKDKQAQNDIEVIQYNLFVDGTDLLNKNAYGSYAKKYSVRKEKIDPNVSKTAAEWITEFKSDAISNGNSPTHVKDAARIIAARQLSDAVRRVGARGKTSAG